MLHHYASRRDADTVQKRFNINLAAAAAAWEKEWLYPVDLVIKISPIMVSCIQLLKTQ